MYYGGQHGVRVADPDQGDLLEMRQVGQVSYVKHGLPARQAPGVKVEAGTRDVRGTTFLHKAIAIQMF